MADNDKTIEIVEVSGNALTRLKAHAYAELEKMRPADGTPSLAKGKTPWAVICRVHGQQFLTSDGYQQQMSDPASRWACPVAGCGKTSEWDDDNYEEALENEDSRLHGEDFEPDWSCKGDNPDT